MRGALVAAATASLLALAPPAAALTCWDAAPAPALRPPSEAVTEADVDALAAGDPRRAERLLDLAVARHLAAEATEREERARHGAAAAAWRLGQPHAVLATPGADTLRAEAARLAQRAISEGSAWAGLPDALIVVGLDAERTGRSREAVRALATLVRRYSGEPLAGDAWLALAEHHLASGDLTRARAAYQRAELGGTVPVKAWAAARLAEVAWAASDLEGLASALERAVDLGSVQGLALLDEVAGAPRRLGARPQALGRVAALLERTAEVARAASLRAAVPGASKPPADADRTLPGARRFLLRTTAPPVDVRGPARDVLRLSAATGDAAALHALALAAIAAGRAGEARRLLERAAVDQAAAASRLATVDNDLAVIVEAQGEKDEARALLRRALGREPSHAVAQQNLRLLDETPPALPGAPDVGAAGS